MIRLNDHIPFPIVSLRSEIWARIATACEHSAFHYITCLLFHCLTVCVFKAYSEQTPIARIVFVIV